MLDWAAWQLQYSPTAWGTIRKHFTKPLEQVAAPPSTRWSISSDVGLNLVYDVSLSCPAAQPLLPTSHQPKQDQAEGGRAKTQSQPNPTIPPETGKPGGKEEVNEPSNRIISWVQWMGTGPGRPAESTFSTFPCRGSVKMT